MARKRSTQPEPTPVSDAPPPFHLLPRQAQLRELLAHRQRLRAETADYLGKLAHWNRTQEARGEEPLGRDHQMEAQLDWLDGQIAADKRKDAS